METAVETLSRGATARSAIEGKMQLNNFIIYSYPYADIATVTCYLRITYIYY